MKNKIETILLSISSKTTSRLYLILFKDYLQRTWPDIRVNYFISQYDHENSNLKRAAVLESSYAARGADLIVDFDGYMDKNLYEGSTCPKVLFHLPETGIPKNISAYLSGFDYLILGQPGLKEIFQEKADQKKVVVLDGLRDLIGEELGEDYRKKKAKERLYREYPDLAGKRVLSLVVRGICEKQELDAYKQFPLKEFLKKLPEDVVFLTNCAQLKVASEMISCKYSEKYIYFSQEKTEDVLAVSDWVVSNLSIASYLKKPTLYINYSGCEFEKMLRRIGKEPFVSGKWLMEKMMDLLQRESLEQKPKEQVSDPPKNDFVDYFLENMSVEGGK